MPFPRPSCSSLWRILRGRDSRWACSTHRTLSWDSELGALPRAILLVSGGAGIRGSEGPPCPRGLCMVVKGLCHLYCPLRRQNDQSNCKFRSSINKIEMRPNTRVCTLLMLAHTGGVFISCSLDACEFEHLLDKLCVLPSDGESPLWSHLLLYN